MQVIIEPDAMGVGKRAADQVEAVLRGNPAAVLGVATGSSPLAAYAELARRVAAGGLDFAAASAFALDEYLGLPPRDAHSYAEAIRLSVTEPLRMDPARVHVPSGDAHDPTLAARYERALTAAGGVDIQIVGIGSNGHLGFNEPGSALDCRTRIAELSLQTRRDNSRFFGSLDEVPTRCITQGLGTILDARRLVLIAQGSTKARAIARALDGAVSVECPASVLQRHPAVTVILDEAAAAELVSRRPLATTATG
jgi:glucosamine-6-phosphate deaminase